MSCTTGFPASPRMALTATADATTRDDILAKLAFDTGAERFVSRFDRPNIRYTVRAKTDANAQLRAFLEEHRGEAGIVYAMTRKKTESIAEMLNARGFTAPALPCRPARRCPSSMSKPIPSRRRRHRRRHDRVRHGHRQARCPIRRPHRPAEECRGLLPGNGPGPVATANRRRRG